MTINYTTLLGLAQPVTGTEANTWGTAVNDQITGLLDTAVAGTTTLSSDADVTLTTTAGAANTSRQAVILWTASGTVTRNITAPAQSKTYMVINSTGSTQSIVLRGAGPTTGITVVAGEKCVAAWNGSDFVKIASSVADGVTTITFGSTGLTPSTATSGAVTVAGTLAVANGGTGLTAGTSGGVLAYTASGTLASSAALTQYGVVYGGGAGAVPVATANGTTGQAFVATTSSAPSWGVVGAVGGGTGVSNNAASTITISGNFGTTLTVTATTAITLPTTGTLATLAGAEGLTNKTLTNPTVTNYVESVVAIGNSSTAQTLSLTNGTVQTCTLTGNCTFTMPTATAGKSFILILSTGAGSFTGTFTSVKWPNNTAPTITTTASRWDILTFVADGTNWYGTYAQAFA